MAGEPPVLPWELLADLYGGEVSQHRDRLAEASETTYALLACNLVGASRFSSQSGKHAEKRLLQSDLWQTGIPAALEQHNDLSTRPVVVTIAINRACCGDCALTLAEKLTELEDRFPARVERNYFILAARGYYQSGRFGNASGNRDPNTLEYSDAAKKLVTTSTGLNALQKSGWTQCVLTFDGVMSRRGEELLEYLSNQRLRG